MRVVDGVDAEPKCGLGDDAFGCGRLVKLMPPPRRQRATAQVRIERHALVDERLDLRASRLWRSAGRDRERR
jgi:hypothetical protein